MDNRTDAGKPATSLKGSVLVAFIVPAAALSPQSSAQERDAWASKFQNLSPAQAVTLLALARDLFPYEELGDPPYMRCIEPYDARARNPEAKQRIDDTLIGVQGASMRLGYAEYAAITDEYERMRLAKMIGEGMWMRQFRAELDECLGAQPDVAKLKKAAPR